MKKIKYIGFYDVPNQEYNRASALPATNKMDYICDALNRAGFAVHLVSPSWFDETAILAKFHKTETVVLHKNKKLTLVSSFGTTNKWTRNFKVIYSLLWLFFWILRNIRRNEKILVYHSPWLALPILLAKKIKGFHLVLEVEEIYSDVSSLHPFFDTLEKRIFENADSFLFSTEFLATKLSNNKNYAILYGNYNVPEKLAFPPTDGKIHLLYAGIIDSHKAGAFNAIEAALFLNEYYVMHIIGFGETEKLQIRINEINLTSKCKVFFDGVKSGEEYIKFCQSCHIGLSTQKMDGSYLESSFPSKILSYLSMGLNVISCDIKCVTTSKISNLVNYYNGSGEEIGLAIIKMDIKKPQHIKAEIEELDSQFLIKLKKIFI